MPQEFDPIEEGRICLRHGRFEEAVRHFQEAVRLGGGDQARSLLEKARKVRDLSSSRNQGAALESDQVRNLREAFEDAYVSRRYDESFRAAESLLGVDPNAGVRALRDRWLKGEAPSIASASASPLKSFFEATEFWGREEDDAAVRLIRAGASNPDCAWMFYFSAEILLRRRADYAAAHEEIDRAVLAGNWFWESRCLRSEILAGRGRRNEGLSDLDSVEVTQPRSRLAFLAWRGAQWMWAGRPERALEDLDVAAAGDNHDSFCWRGGARCLLEDHASAISDLDKVLDIDPGDPEARIWRAEAHRIAGNESRTRDDLEEALRRSDGSANPWARLNAAALDLRSGRNEEAVREFSYAVCDQEREPASTVALERVGEALRIAFEKSGGCRRQDAHLNRAWMLESGVEVPQGESTASLFETWASALGFLR